MWGITSLNGLSTSAKYEALGRPLKQTITFVYLWKQGELVCPIKVPQNLCTEEFYLGDFSLSEKLSDPITQRGHPLYNTVPLTDFISKIQASPVICGAI